MLVCGASGLMRDVVRFAVVCDCFVCVVFCLICVCFGCKHVELCYMLRLSLLLSVFVCGCCLMCVPCAWRSV